MLYVSFWHLFIMTSAALRTNPALQMEMQVVGVFFCTEMLLFFAANTASECSLNITSNEELALKCFLCLLACCSGSFNSDWSRMLKTFYSFWNTLSWFLQSVTNKTIYFCPSQYEIMSFAYLFDALSKWTSWHDFLSSLNMRMGPLNLNLKKT